MVSFLSSDIKMSLKKIHFMEKNVCDKCVDVRGFLFENSKPPPLPPPGYGVNFCGVAFPP